MQYAKELAKLAVMLIIIKQIGKMAPEPIKSLLS